MKRVGFFLAASLCWLAMGAAAWAQTNPPAQPLPYSQNFNSLAHSSTTYPAGWQGWQLGAGSTTSFRTNAPTADLPLNPSGSASTTAGGVHNYNGKIGFLQTGSSDPSLALAVDTTGLTGIQVVYDAMTVRNPYDGGTNTRVNEMTLQYRVGTSGSFTNLTGVEYQNNTTQQTGSGVTTPQNPQGRAVVLPAACNNQPVVQLRWAAREVSGGGSRPSFAVDNVQVAAEAQIQYRSAASGSWNSTSTWEQSTDGATWTPATSTPTSASGPITVRAPHVVTVTASVDADELVVNTGAQLAINNGVTFTVADGPGTDLTADGTLATAGAVANNGQTLINGTFQLNTGGFITAPPTYAAGSLLRYNTGGTYGRFNEWTSTGGAGYPFNVQLSNNTTLDLGANGGTTTAFQAAGSLTIDPGSVFQMAGANPLTQPVTILGGVNIGGTLTLSTALGGDLKLGGDWTRAPGSNFNRNNRAVFFVGTTTQTVTITGGGVETFAYLVVDKPAGDLTLSNSPPTSVVVDSPAGGSALQLVNAGGVNLNGNGMTLSGTVAGTNILVGGTAPPAARTVTGPGVFDITNGAKSVTSNNAKTLVFGTGVAVTISQGFDFGPSLTTVNGSLVITTGGFVNTNPPTYGTGSTLVYNCTCVYTRGAEWSTTSGPGHPFNVTVNDGAGTDLNLGANSPAAMRGSLLVNAGGSLNLDGSDLQLGGNFTVNGNFAHGNRTVTFDGTAPQTINGAGAITFFNFVTAPGASVTSAVSFSVAGNWTNNGAYTGASETVTFNGGAGQSVGGANPTNFNNVSIANPSGVALTSNQNVNGNLDLAAGDVTTGANVLTQPSTASPATGGSTGDFDVVGNVRRTGFVNGVPLNFGNPNTRIAFNTGTPPSEVTVNLVKSRPFGVGFGFPNAVNRTYTITPAGGANYTATLRLHYKDGELFGTPAPAAAEEAALDLWRFNGVVWQRVMKTNADVLTANDNWVESNAVTQFSPWTLSATPLAPTVTRLRTLRATPHADGMLVEWQTTFEADNLGFNLYRELDGRRTLLTPSPVAGSALVAGAAGLASGNAYSWIDRDADPRALYWLEDIDLHGDATLHGPFKPTVKRERQRLPLSPRSTLLDQLGAGADARAAQTQWMPARTHEAPATGGATTTTALTEDASTASPTSAASVERQRGLAARAAVKLSVRRPGWYRVTRAQLEAAGLGPNALPSHLQLYADGVEQAISVNEHAWLTGAGAVEFYGEGLDTAATDTRVYWLVEGDAPGRRTSAPLVAAPAPGDADAPATDGAAVNVKTSRRAVGVKKRGDAAANSEVGDPLPTPVPPPTIIVVPPAADPNAGPASFNYTAERRDREVYFSSLLNGDEENFFGRVVNPTAAPQLITVRDLDDTTAAPAGLAVAVQGVTAGAHEVRLTLNGVEVGRLRFAGRERRTAAFSVNASLVREGDNEVRLVSASASDVSLTDYIRLSYMRRYRAEGNALRFAAAGGLPLRVRGFTSRDIRVVDVTDPNGVEDVPAVVEPETAAEGNGFAVRFTPRADTPARTILAFTNSAAAEVSGVAPNRPSTLSDGANGADLLVLTHRDFRESIAPLVARREREGLIVKVVDVEDVFDEFSYGAHAPRAVKDFFAAARSSWSRAPRYALLVGDGSYDPRNRMRRGSFDFVPARLIDATHLETASDDWYADFDGDDLADFAVGRLPVRTPAEAALVANKLAAYAPAEARAAAVTVADRLGADGYSFETATDGVEELLRPAGLAVERVNRGARTAADVRAEVTARINAGPLLVNYMGHGSVNVWTGEGLLRGVDAPALANGARLPFFVLMTCLNGNYTDPSLESLGEALLKAEHGGALAVWASTGLTEPDGQLELNRELYRLLFHTAEPLTLGEATRRAKAATADRDVRRTWVLIGDPSTRLR